MSTTPLGPYDIGSDYLASPSYTLGDLLGDPLLGVQLATGTTGAGDTPIVGAYAVELERPTERHDSGWMLLTCGAGLRRRPQAQRELITEVADRGISCLGFGLGPSFRSVPPALLDEAKKRRVPVVVIPERTSFREVTQAVFRATQSREASVFTRLSSLQQNLLLALSDPRPLDSIVQRLGRLTHASVALMSAAGDIKAATGPVPALDSVLRALHPWSAGVTEIRAGEWHVVASPLEDAGQVERLALVVASRGAAAGRDIVRAAVQVAVPVLGASLRLSSARVDQDRAMQASLLDSALEDELDASGERALASRIAVTGTILGPEARVVVIQFRSEEAEAASPHPAEQVESWVRSRLEGGRAPHLASCRGDHVALLLSDESLMRALCEDLLTSWPTSTIGVGRPAEDVGQIRSSYLDAQLAVQQLTMQEVDRVLRYDDLDLVTQLLAEVPVDRFRAKAAETMRLLEDNPIQLEALRAYFAKNRDIKAAAESIYLHPNTLRYRLERLEQALGRSLHEPSVTASLYCVLAMLETPTTAAGRA